MIDHNIAFVTLLLFALVMITRSLAFIIGPRIAHFPIIDKLKKYLPAMIMLILTVYELSGLAWRHSPYGIPAIIALLTVVIVHVTRRNMIISMFAGTGIYLFVNWLIMGYFHGL